jgi:hypothetical protein
MDSQLAPSIIHSFQFFAGSKQYRYDGAYRVKKDERQQTRGVIVPLYRYHTIDLWDIVGLTDCVAYHRFVRHWRSNRVYHYRYGGSRPKPLVVQQTTNIRAPNSSYPRLKNMNEATSTLGAYRFTDLLATDCMALDKFAKAKQVVAS